MTIARRKNLQSKTAELEKMLFIKLRSKPSFFMRLRRVLG